MMSEINTAGLDDRKPKRHVRASYPIPVEGRHGVTRKVLIGEENTAITPPRKRKPDLVGAKSGFKNPFGFLAGTPEEYPFKLACQQEPLCGTR